MYNVHSSTHKAMKRVYVCEQAFVGNICEQTCSHTCVCMCAVSASSRVCVCVCVRVRARACAHNCKRVYTCGNA